MNARMKEGRLIVHPLFTIGHSILGLPLFVYPLKQNQVELLIDVRSKPESYRSPHFSQPEFEMSLREAGIHYLFLGEELGGRPDDPKAYRADGLVNYRARRQSYGFRAGIERVLVEAEKQTVAIMCAEEDPLSCHRFLMICPALVEAGLQPLHIRKDGVIEIQQEAEDRLLKAVHFQDVRSDSLFGFDRRSALEDAYTTQAEKRAFRADPQTVDYW